MGLAETYGNVRWAANLFPSPGLTASLSQAIRIANPLAEWQTQMNAWQPRLNVLGLAFDTTRYARSIFDKVNSLSGLARPFAASELVAPSNPLGNWAKLQHNLLHDPPFGSMQRSQHHLVTLVLSQVS